MKVSTTLILLMLVISAYGQRCSYLANSVSEFDGSHLVITEPVTLTKNFDEGTLEVYTSLYADTAVMLSFVLYPGSEISLDASDMIILTLEDGTTVELNMHKQPVMVEKPSKKVTCNVLLCGEKVSMLKSSVVSSVGFRHNETLITAPVDRKKAQDAIAGKISCILNTI